MAIRGDKRTKKEQQEAFLAAFMECANVSLAAKKAKINRSTHYICWMKDEKYAKRFEEILPVAVGVLEDEAIRRAVDGVKKPIFHKGEIVGHVKEYSDTLMIVLLKAHAPNKYKERVQNEHGGSKELPPIETQNVVKTTLKL